MARQQCLALTRSPAVAVAYMVLGLRFASADLDSAAKKTAYNKVRQFAQMFKQRNSSTVCAELLGCDISTPEGLQELKDKQLITSLCSGFVKDAVEILDKLL